MQLALNARNRPATWAGPVVLFGLAAAMLAWMIAPVIGQGVSLGRDLDLYLDATRRLLAGGSFYRPEQIAGPYAIAMGDVLYPPSTIPLFVPFLWLPGFLWWAVPLGIIAAVVWSWRPSPLGWAVIAVCLTFPNSVALVLNGNPVMWAAAGVAIGTRTGWGYALALLKPTVAIVGLLGVRDRRWWLVAALGLAVGLPFAGLWPDYVTTLGNVRGSSLLYSLGDLPFVLVPVIAWIGRARPSLTWSGWRRRCHHRHTSRIIP